jgi:hypothetical protein
MNRSSVLRKMLLPSALTTACASMILISFGPLVLRDSSIGTEGLFVCKPQYKSLREYQFESEKPDESSIRCEFGGISFVIPSAMADHPRVFRSSPTSIWLVFEDSGRFTQIPLSDPAPSTLISEPPSELAKTTVPGLIAKIAAVASDDSVKDLSVSERSIYDWAIVNRESIGIDALMDRFALRSSDTFHAILISIDPSSSFSEKQVRSWLIWHETESGKSGSFMFCDADKDGAKWINAFATSLEYVSGVAPSVLSANDYSTMSDAEILNLLHTELLTNSQLE